jgi:hypothetical protein
MEEVPILYLPAKENEFCNEEENKVTNLWKQKDKENVMAAHSRDAPEIIINSGCSRHVCGTKMKQHMMEWCHGPRVKVTVADGKTHESNLYGMITATVMTKTMYDMSGNGKLLLEVLTGRVGHLEMLKPFGCRVYIQTNGSLQITWNQEQNQVYF